MKFLLKFSTLVFCAAIGTTALAEDIDLFQGVNPDNAATVDILVVMDNAARASSSAEPCPVPKQVKNPQGQISWVYGTPFGIHQCALASVVSQLPDTQVRLGVMMFRGPQTQKYTNGTVTDCVDGYSSNGGCAVFPMTRLDTNGKAAFLDWLSRWDTGAANRNKGSVNIAASNVTVAGALQEAYAYLKGSGAQGLSNEVYSQPALYQPGEDECDASAYLVYIGTSWDQNGQPRDAVEAGDALYNTDPSIASAKRANPPEDAQSNPLIARQVRTVCKPKGNTSGTTNPPSPVASFSASSVSPTRVNFSWVGSEGADSYVVSRYKKRSTGNRFDFEKQFITFPTTTDCFDQPGVAGTYQYSIASSLEGQKATEVFVLTNNGKAREFNLGGGVAESSCDQASAGSETETEILEPEKHPQANGAYQYADEWTRYLKNRLGVRTYTVGLINKDECFASYPGVMTSMAVEGGGEYFESYDFEGIEDALGNIFSQILATNSVFASVSLPISVNTEDTFLNQVYIGMFRPDGEARPRWQGNLKAYQLGFEGEELRLKDADNGRAIASSSTGFIDACARSFWTPANGSDYWPNNDFYANCLPEGRAMQDGPDGQIVEKGGAGYGLRQSDATARNIQTYNPATGQLASFETSLFSSYSDAAKMSLFDVADVTEVSPIIIWAEGQFNVTGGADADGFLPLGDTRSSIHGDVIHSRPKAIDFNETDDDNSSAVVVFYGANDGTLRAINGNLPDGLADSIAGEAPGEEIWAFLPPEFYPELKRLRDNSVPIDFEGIPRCEPQEGETQGPCRPKPYGMDGPVSAYISGDPGDGNYRAIIYATMRRGGRMIYAFDVSDIADGTNPTLAWRFGCNDSGVAGQVVSCTHSGLGAKIGQTWSSPQPATLADGTPVVIFGGGYDECEDTDSLLSACASGTRGSYVYILHAETGVILREFSLAASIGTGEVARPVAADVIVVPDKDESGTLAYAYVTDLGGNVYRLSAANGQAIRNSQPNSWELIRIARLGCTSSDSANCNRKFFYPPDVIRPLSGGLVLLLGSGDREKPLPAETYPNAAAVQNYFYALYDDPLNEDAKKPQLSELPGDFSCPGNYICMNALAPVTMAQTDAAAQQDALNNYYAGWRLALRPSEQTVTSTITVLGTSIFSTHTPETPESAVSCEANLGTARAYQVNYATGQGAGSNNQRSAEIEGGGLPPSPVAGLVKVGNEVVPFVIGANARSALEAALPGEGAFPREPKGKRYWYIQR